MSLNEGIARILIDEHLIRCRVQELGSNILADFGEERILVVILLKGALVFSADLFRCLPVMLDVECLNVASYHGGTESSGSVEFLDNKLPEVEGRNVLIVDDILDTGRTLHAVSKAFFKNGAKVVKTCVLLAKEKKRAVKQEADYTGFTIGDEFVVGYGLDYKGLYRNLPYIGVLDPSLI
jgi:hypoxanthine phosphoribosyltransferase